MNEGKFYDGDGRVCRLYDQGVYSFLFFFIIIIKKGGRKGTKASMSGDGIIEISIFFLYSLSIFCLPVSIVVERFFNE